MTQQIPLLSLCIPTYNRAEILDVVLQHYAELPQLKTGEIEIIISDNNSPDKTKDICQKYAELCPNIRYYRNEVNIRDGNFYTVLNYGKGQYLKLLNDCFYISEANINYMLAAIKDHFQDRKQIFFTNNFLYTKHASEYMECSNLDEYVQRVSSYITAINLFGAWKEDWESLVQDKNKYQELQLMQDDWTYQLVTKKEGCVLYNKMIYTYVPRQNMFKGGYDWFKIHVDNYYIIMAPYITAGLISQKTLKQDRKYLLWHFKGFLYNDYILRRSNNFASTKPTQYLRKYYRHDAYYYYYMGTLPIRFVFDKIPHIPQIVKRLIASKIKHQ